MEAIRTAPRRAGAWAWYHLKAIKPALFSRTPHFSFITAHYLWIVSATMISSTAIYVGGQGETDFIDCLMFGSGANTQAGLNPVNINDLRTFQQTMIYLFAMMSNPITLHGTVVFLRLYWFEKRFQGWVRDAKARRMTLTKTRSKSRAKSTNELSQAEAGVRGRNIMMLPGSRSQRMTNDGIMLEASGASGQIQPTIAEQIDESETSGSGKRPDSSTTGPSSNDASDIVKEEEIQPLSSSPPHGITFADTVKRSDGIEEESDVFQRRKNAEHIAILNRQRNQDDEVLRIPGPRDQERGLGPRRLQEDDQDEDDVLSKARTMGARPDNATVDNEQGPERPARIVIAEPDRRKRDELADDAKAFGNTFESLRFRKPRFMNRGQKKVHEDGESETERRTTKTLETIKSVLSRDKTDDMPYLSYNPTIGRNSNFIGLSLEEREELGGIEYRSLRTLALIIVLYFWGFQLLSLTTLLPFILHSDKYGAVVDDADQSRTWWAFFTANSAFMDVGFTLTPDSMNSFNTSAYVLMFMWFFIIIGNTGFPVMLRFVIWVLAQIMPSGSGLWEELRFLLDHPRRCFTLLFPSAANWWLFFSLVVLNFVDLIFFIVLDLHTGPIAELPLHTRILDGTFQAASTRTAGFSCVNLALLHPAMPVLYMIMMYISVFPIAISIRRTNVYEEKSLGIYTTKKDDDEDEVNEATSFSYVGSHIRRQLSFDLWFVFLGFFIVTISESSKIQDGKFGMFEILFEIISAYGTVGLSLGVPYADTSLCAQFSTVGKLVIVAMEIRGRHRGLPYGLDRAVLLPSESRFKREAEEADTVLVRTNTGGSRGNSIARGSSINRGRSQSRGRERSNSKYLTSFLFPGPPVPRGVAHTHRRTKSNDSRFTTGDDLRRVRTELSHDAEMKPLSPIHSADRPKRYIPRRADSTPMI